MTDIMQIINHVDRRIITAVAVAIALHLGACTETLVVYDHADVEIGLAPVNRISTKMLSGSMEGTAYDYMESFGILAWYQDAPAGQSWTGFYDAGDVPSPYITNSGAAAKGEFICIDKNTDDKTGTTWAGGSSTASVTYDKNADKANRYVKKGQPDIRIDTRGTDTRQPYYWPKSGSLAFAGYSPYDIMEQDGISVTYDAKRENPGIKITGIKQGSFEYAHDKHWAANGTFDLMWFDVDDQSSFSARADAVPVTFRHACAWIDFRIKAAAGYEDRFSLVQVILTNVYWKGNFDSAAAQNREWSGLGNMKSETVLFDHDGQPGEDNPDDDEFVKIDADGFYLGNMIAIPQELAGKGENSEAVTRLVLKFRQHTSDDTDTLIQTYACDLDDITENGRWEIGKHYIYNIEFTLHKIQVEPEVADWEERQGSVTVS